MQLQGEDLETFNRLREKYSPNAQNGAFDPCTACIPAPRGSVNTDVVSHKKGAGIDARMCVICHGQGIQVEIYNHRRLEKMCEACSGRGVVVYKDGVEVKEPETTSRHSAMNSDRDSSQAQDQEQGSSNKMSDEQAQALRDEVQKISNKLQQYEAERLDLSKRLETCRTGEDSKQQQSECELLKQLLDQISAHVKKLRSVRSRKEAQLLIAGKTLTS